MMLLEIGVPLSRSYKTSSFSSRAPRWVGVYWRDYSYGPNIAVGHYYTFQTITDLACWRLPSDRRSWWHPFRATVALSFIFLDVSLVLNGAEELDVPLGSSVSGPKWVCIGALWAVYTPSRGFFQAKTGIESTI